MDVTVDGRTRLYGVMGWPVAHSLSPALHNAAYRALGLNYAYVPLPVHPEKIEAAVRGLVGLGFAGSNVTVPHKPAVLPLMDELSPIAAAIGSVNTITVRADGTLLGDSTDGYGFIADLRAHGCEPGPGLALLIGAGGSARAVAHALAELGVPVAVANRRLERAEELCAAVRSALPGARISAHHFPSALAALAPGAGLIVNTTSAGLQGAGESELPWDLGVPFHSGQVAYDIVYGQVTPFLALAAAGGACTIDGLGMLVHQGARSFELWTGLKAPVDVMAAAAGQARQE